MLSRRRMLAAAGIVGMALGSRGVAGEQNPGRLEGGWTAVRAEQDAREAAEIVGHLLRFEGNTFSIREKGATIYEGTFEVDASANPRTIDFKHTGESSRGKTWRGIYRIDGDTLTICDNAGDVQKGRPTSFGTKPDSGRVLVVFKRAPR